MPLTCNEAANQWQGDNQNQAAPDLAFNTYAQLVDPETVAAGTLAVVLGDANDRLNGLHVAHGPKGGMGVYWAKA